MAMTNIPHYSMVIEWDPKDQIYIVMVPELPGCITHGSTYEEAIAQGKDAIESWVTIALIDGETLPACALFVAAGRHDVDLAVVAVPAAFETAERRGAEPPALRPHEVAGHRRKDLAHQLLGAGIDLFLANDVDAPGHRRCAELRRVFPRADVRRDQDRASR